MKYTESPVERGMYYRGKGNIWMGNSHAGSPSAGKPYTYEDALDSLPEPILPSRPAWLGCYNYAMKIAFANAKLPESGSGFLSSFIDAAFNQNIFLWDTVFITMFADFARPFLPGIEALDNFYAKQLPDGEIPREMIRKTGEDMPFWVNREGLPLHSYFHNHYGHRKLATHIPPKIEEMYFPDLGRPQKEIAWYTLDNLNHPILAWGELSSYALTGNAERLAEVFPPLLKQYEAMRMLLMHANGLYVSDWASMDNSPRNKYLGCCLDTSCEMALFAGNLLEIMNILESRFLAIPDEKLRKALEAHFSALKETCNRLLWDDKEGFYFDLKQDGTRAPVKTIAAYWAMAASIAEREQAERLVRWLENPDAFKRLHRVPVCAASGEGYDPRGGYWRGSVWAPTNTMVLYGLEKYGYNALAREIALNHLDAVAKVWEETGTIWENYPPDSISSADADKKDFVGWSGLGPIRYLLRYAIGLVPDAPANTLRWNLNMGLLLEGGLGCRHFRFGQVETELLARLEGERLIITVSTNTDYALEIAVGEMVYRREARGRMEYAIPTCSPNTRAARS